MVDGSTSHNLRKLITSAPMFGTTRLSLIDRNDPKLNNIHIIINPSGRNSLISERSIGQNMSLILRVLMGFLSLDIQFTKNLL